MKFKWKYVIIYIIINIIIFFSLPTIYQRYILYNFSDVNDYKIFPYRELKRNLSPFYFKNTKKPIYPKIISDINNNKVDLENYLEKNNTIALIIIKNDTIQFEKYFNNYKRDQIIPSFSVTKSIVSMLIGCAIDDGLIKSIKEPITNYIPEMKKNGFKNVTIEHLLKMTSGIEFNEDYFTPFSDVAQFYYGDDLRKLTINLRLKEKPGKKFKYASGNSQILGLILERALKSKTITQYMQEKIWTPLQMEYNASWSLDSKKNKMERTFSSFNATAIDFAKIGRLYLNKGKWNEKTILSQKWVEESVMVDTTNGSVKKYQYQWQLPNQSSDFYYARGYLGQYILVYPAKKIIIVRFGEDRGEMDIDQWDELLINVSKFYDNI